GRTPGSWRAGCGSTGSSRVTILRRQPRGRRGDLGRCHKAGAAVAAVIAAAPGQYKFGGRFERRMAVEGRGNRVTPYRFLWVGSAVKSTSGRVGLISRSLRFYSWGYAGSVSL